MSDQFAAESRPPYPEIKAELWSKDLLADRFAAQTQGTGVGRDPHTLGTRGLTAGAEHVKSAATVGKTPTSHEEPVSDPSTIASPAYRTIVADPPWEYEEFAGYQGTPGRSNWRRVTKALPYASMSLADIERIDVASLAASDCRLFFWTTNRYLPDAFQIIKAWGFSYKQTLVWHKTGRPFPHGGSLAPNHAEYLIIGTRGNPPVVSRVSSSVLSLPRPHRHSRKPEAFLDLAETTSPPPYLEMFARRQRLGWDTWGNEALPHVEMSA